MTTAELVNLILSKLGGNRVEFLEIYDWRHNGDLRSVARFRHSGNAYIARCQVDAKEIWVRQEDIDQVAIGTPYSEWIEGVLNGMVRNDAGKLVKP